MKRSCPPAGRREEEISTGSRVDEKSFESGLKNSSPVPPTSFETGRAELDRKILTSIPCSVDELLSQFIRIERSETERQLKTLARWGWVRFENRDGTTYILPGERMEART